MTNVSTDTLTENIEDSAMESERDDLLGCVVEQI